MCGIDLKFEGLFIYKFWMNRADGAYRDFGTARYTKGT